MSSMVRSANALLLAFMVAMSAPAQCQDGAEWDRARAELMAGQRGTMTQAIQRWQQLSDSNSFAFDSYAGFLLSYAGFPEEAKLRGYAEAALERETVDAARQVAYFRRFPPVTSAAKGRYALALTSLRLGDASTAAVSAWRSGTSVEAVSAALLANHAGSFSLADHDARMDALLWAGATTQAQAQLGRTTAAARELFTARLALIQGQDPASVGLSLTPAVLRDPGYVFNRVRQLKRSGNTAAAVNMLATRPRFDRLPFDQTRWVTELLNTARGADAASAVRIAESIDDAFVAGADISRMSYKLRDDYTSLMWLGGMKAIKSLGAGSRAAPLFFRYGSAARTPQTRTKGFYWAGRALAQSGDRSGANRYFEMAAVHGDHFYGMLALERLGRPLPSFTASPIGSATSAERAAFNSKPLTAAVREVATGWEWPTTVRFFREISDRAESEGDHLLVAELARTIGRRDLAVILGQAAHADGLGNFQTISFPLVPTPPGTDWTVVHAITRQESQFAMNAISHAGARGLMQLMPGTAREQARINGMEYTPASLVSDANYNIRLGDAYFARMMDIYGGSYPLAAAAYNAGPGNVNKWLRSNGDPRGGSIDWIDWLENIPVAETRNYVQRVLENAVVYEAMNPARARYKGDLPLSHFVGKRNPG